MKKRVFQYDLKNNPDFDTELGKDINSQLYIDSRERYDYLNFVYSEMNNVKRTKKEKLSKKS